MRFYGKAQLLDLLIPWTGFNILIRKGQTAIVDKFYSFAVGLMHRTMKINYMEVFLYSGVVRRVVSRNVRYVLYEKRHIVYNAHATALDTNGGIDEGVENGIIYDAKLMSTNDPRVLQTIPPWLAVIGCAYNILKLYAGTASRSEPINSDLMIAEQRGRVSDREKRTARNVASMLALLEDRQFLGPEHLGGEYLKNVLLDENNEVRDDTFAYKLIIADKVGRMIATLHLSTKMYYIFGDLTVEEAAYYFPKRSPLQLRDHWTNANLFKSMADALNIEPADGISRSSRKEAGDLKKELNSRRQQVSETMLQLYKIREESEQGSARQLAAGKLMQHVERNRHLLSTKAYAFRAHLETDEPYRSLNFRKTSFYSTFQDYLLKSRPSMLPNPTALFLEPEPEILQTSVASIHIDISGDIRKAPSIQMKDNFLGGAIFEKMKRTVSVYINNYLDIIDFHVHVDVKAWIPLQKYRESSTRRVYPAVGSRSGAIDGRITTSSADTVQVVGGPVAPSTSPVGNLELGMGVAEAMQEVPGEEDQQEVVPAQHSQQPGGNLDSGMQNRPGSVPDGVIWRESGVYSGTTAICDTRTSLQRSWNSIINDRDNIDYLMSLHAVLSAQAAVQLLQERISGSASVAGGGSTAQGGSLSNTRQQDKEDIAAVYIHGAAIAIAKEARNCRLDELQFLRYGDAVLVLPSTSSASSVQSFSAPNFVGLSEEVDIYDPSCCWTISQEGLTRYPNGDSQHGQAQSRFVYALKTITQASLHESAIPDEKWKILLVSNHSETPLIVSMCPTLERFHIVHRLEEGYVDIQRLKAAICSVGISVMDIALLYVLSGCDECPGSVKIPQSRFLLLYLKATQHFGHIFVPELLNEETEFTEDNWGLVEALIALGFRAARESWSNVPAELYNGMANGRFKWSHEMRRKIARMSNVQCPSLLLPEHEDLELHVRRAYCILRYWLQSGDFSCSSLSLGGLSAEFGYTSDGYPLYEKEQDVLKRERILKKVTQTCGCTTGCKTRRCRCRQGGRYHSESGEEVDGPLLCLLCSCKNCENTGMTEAERQRLAPDQRSLDPQHTGEVTEIAENNPTVEDVIEGSNPSPAFASTVQAREEEIIDLVSRDGPGTENEEGGYESEDIHSDGEG